MKFISFILLIMCTGQLKAQEIGMYITRASAYSERMMFAGAAEEYTRALSISDDYRLYTGRGEAMIIIGDISLALDDFNKANQIEPGSGYLGLARAYALNNEPSKAIENLRNHLMSGFRLPRKEIMLDAAFAGLEDSKDWRELWKTKWYTQLEEAESEIEYYAGSGKVEDAESVLSGIDNLYNERIELLYLKAVVKAAGSDSKTALGYLRQAIEKGDTSIKTWKLYINQLGETENYLAAADACDKALLYYPRETELIYMKSGYLRMSGEHERALRTAEKYLGLFPDNEDANRQAGLTAADNGEYGKAIRCFTHNIENFPGKSQCYTDRAGLYMNMKAWDAAVYDYSMALDLWPRNGDAYYNKGLALINEGKTDEACHDFRMATRYGDRRAASMINRYCIK